MNQKTTPTMFLVLTAVVLCSQLTLAQSPNSQKLGMPVIESTSSPHISAVHSKNTTDGSMVIIISEEILTDYGAYRNGENFVILIPQATIALNNISVDGTAFTEPKVEARGTNLIFSFHLAKGVNAGVSQKGKLLEVNFARREAAASREIVDPGTHREATLEPAAPGKPRPRKSEASAASVNRAVAEPTPAAAGTGTVDQVDVDLSVPESPAFTVLGVTPETASRPTTPREFATSLLNGVDQRGNFQTGLAMDFVPFLTFFGRNTSLFSYAHSRMERFLARTQFSFATTKGVTEEDKATRLALGLRLTLWDTGDPRLDDALEKCYDKADDDPRLEGDDYVPAPDDSSDVKKEKLLKRSQLLAQLIKPCNDASRKRNWNASGWIVGAAPSWISKSGQTKDFNWNGGGFWTSLAYGFENVSALKDNSQLILHARYRNNEVVPDAQNKGQFFSQDSMFFGGRLRMAPGSEANSIFSLEGNYIRSRRNKGAFDSSYRYSLGLERKLADNIWFSLALGGQSGRSDGTNQAFLLSSFKWGFSQKKN
jgi:hypothetical protein